jgi:pimeloyl-ACP methyl ester carboxylesterase
MITCRAAVVCSLLLAAAGPAWPQQIEWRDSSSHVTTLVTVEEDVRLEVLDWGGSGPPLLLLAGLGDTAHVFDDFAPMLATRHRVLGVTRRGHRRSSAPATGYTAARLAEDVVRVLDAAGLKRPVVVGHSFAGEELHVLAARYSERIAGLVYLDAAFNRADGSEDYDAAARTLPGAPRPQPSDLASFTALRAFLERTQGGSAGPEAHLRARFLANGDGTVGGAWAPELAVRQALTNEMKAMSAAYHPEPIRVPALSVYAVPKSAVDMMRPWYKADDPAVRERVETLYRLARERFARHAKWFGAFAERGRVSEISGAHHLFVSHPDEVVRQIDEFVASLPATP